MTLLILSLGESTPAGLQRLWRSVAGASRLRLLRRPSRRIQTLAKATGPNPFAMNPLDWRPSRGEEPGGAEEAQRPASKRPLGGPELKRPLGGPELKRPLGGPDDWCKRAAIGEPYKIS